MSLPTQLHYILGLLTIIAVSSSGTFIVLLYKTFNIKINNVIPEIHIPEIKLPQMPSLEPCKFVNQEFTFEPCKFQTAVAPPFPPQEPCKFEKCDTLPTATSPFLNEKFPTYNSTLTPKNIINHQIIKSDGTHVGWRHSTHPDIEEALKTPGLAVKYPDGKIDQGAQ